MAYQRQKKQQNKQTQRETLKVTDCKVTRAHQFANGGETFDVRLNGITIYGCRLVDGKNGTFVSFPSRQGKDGKWYSYVYAVLDDQTVEDICTQVAGLLGEEEDGLPFEN